MQRCVSTGLDGMLSASVETPTTIKVLVASLLCGLLAAVPVAALPVGSAFTYQGRLIDGAVPANGSFDLRFTLYDASSGGAQVGPIVTSDAVPVNEGLFVVRLDFGAAAFSGEARWLETAVRPSATGGYTVLSGRQALTPAPQSIASASTPWSGVTGKPAGFADDVDNDSGGTVTSVAAGAGLTGGPIVSSGTLSIALGGVVSSMVANGAIGLAQINTAQVQARVATTCALGFYLRGIGPDGSPLCTGLPNPHTFTEIENVSGGWVGAWSSIAIGTDGLPVISYQDATARSVRVLKCGNLACSVGNSVTGVDTSPNVVAYTSIAVLPSGLPLISYGDSTAGTLKVVRCGTPACTGTNVITTVDDPAVGAVGAYTSLAIGVDGLGVVSYHDSNAHSLKVLKCGNANCNAGNVAVTVDSSANTVGQNSSLAVAPDGLPVVAYYDQTAFALKVLKCGNAGCTAGNVITVVDHPANHVGAKVSLAIGADGLPVISYQDLTTLGLKLAKCGNAACNAGNTITTVDSSPFGVYATALAVASDGRPVIAYNVSSVDVWVTKCGNPACTAGNVSAVLDDPSGSSVGNTLAIAIGSDGLPIVSDANSTNNTLRVVKCGNAACQ